MRHKAGPRLFGRDQRHALFFDGVDVRIDDQSQWCLLTSQPTHDRPRCRTRPARRVSSAPRLSDAGQRVAATGHQSRCPGAGGRRQPRHFGHRPEGSLSSTSVERERGRVRILTGIVVIPRDHRRWDALHVGTHGGLNPWSNSRARV